MFGCPPGAVGARKFARLCPPVPGCGGLSGPIGCPYIKSLEPSMPGGLRLRCPDATLAGWLGWLAGLAGWLGWLAKAGGLLLAGCCWLMEGSLTRSTLWGGRRIYGPLEPTRIIIVANCVHCVIEMYQVETLMIHCLGGHYILTRTE